MFIFDTSVPVRAGNNARFVSPQIPWMHQTGCQFRFFYHMHGMNVGNLKVRVRRLCNYAIVYCWLVGWLVGWLVVE